MVDPFCERGKDSDSVRVKPGQTVHKTATKIQTNKETYNHTQSHRYPDIETKILWDGQTWQIDTQMARRQMREGSKKKEPSR